MERVRLTKRMASKNVKADAAEPATSIDLGKNRNYHKIDEYHTFEPSINHWEPDMRHEWKDNPREETGHGIPKMAKIYMAAKKATKLAGLLLGENATEEAIEKQANAFMRMGDKALTASLALYAEVQEAAPVKEEVTAAEEEAPVKEEATIAEETAPVKEEVAPVKEEATTAEETAPVQEEVTTAEEEGVVEVDDELLSTDIEFDEPADGVDTAADAELEACFTADDGEEDVTPAVETVARKAGVKKLAGQPTLTRVASKKADELSSLWDKWSNPDIR